MESSEREQLQMDHEEFTKQMAKTDAATILNNHSQIENNQIHKFGVNRRLTIKLATGWLCISVVLLILIVVVSTILVSCISSMTKGNAESGQKNGTATHLNPNRNSTKWKESLRLFMPQLENCGHSHLNHTSRRRLKRVIGGEEVKDPHVFPWIGQIGKRGGDDGSPIWGCGGSLISKRYVLTSAHCVYLSDNLSLVVKLRGQSQPINVEEVVVHEQYKRNNANHSIYDLALLRLSKNTEQDYPVCLPFLQRYNLNESQLRNKSGMVAGYGPSDLTLRNYTNLHQVTLSIVPNEECQQFYNHQPTPRIISTIAFCAGNEFGKDFCRGDSGSPFLVEVTKGKYVQRGIASFGTRSCGLGHAGVFVDLLHPLNRLWILEHMRP